jgi:protein ImuB
VDRLACVDVAALPLQILLRARPEWSDVPAAVVEDDRPQARVLFVDPRAARLGVRPGQRYAAALAVARELRAGTVSPSEIDETAAALTTRLRRHSPHVEPARTPPGAFWLDASGLERLHPSLEAWADGIRDDLGTLGLRASAAVAFSRFGAYALATSQPGTVCCADAADERRRVAAVPLARLAIDPGVRERLRALGIDTVGEFLRLPGGALGAQFGAATEALFRLAAGDRWDPLVPVPVEARYEESVDFDAPEQHVERLVFVVKRLLDGLTATMAPRGRAIVAVALRLRLDDGTAHVEPVRPAAPTLDVGQLLALVRLRLDTRQFRSGIVTLGLEAEACAATAEARRLFPAQGRRDPGAADMALATLRAEHGERNVVRAHVNDAHLPAAQFSWEPLAHVPALTAPRVVSTRPFVRRILTTPRPVPPAREAGASRSPGLDSGPYVLSGGWWAGGLHRDYYFAATPGGDVRWLYHDHRRRCVLLQGLVE